MRRNKNHNEAKRIAREAVRAGVGPQSPLLSDVIIWSKTKARAEGLNSKAERELSSALVRQFTSPNSTLANELSSDLNARAITKPTKHRYFVYDRATGKHIRTITNTSETQIVFIGEAIATPNTPDLFMIYNSEPLELESDLGMMIRAVWGEMNFYKSNIIDRIIVVESIMNRYYYPASTENEKLIRRDFYGGNPDNGSLKGLLTPSNYNAMKENSYKSYYEDLSKHHEDLHIRILNEIIHLCYTYWHLKKPQNEYITLGVTDYVSKPLSSNFYQVRNLKFRETYNVNYDPYKILDSRLLPSPGLSGYGVVAFARYVKR
jgi:hypothetical protein